MITTVTITTVRAATPWHYALACPRQDVSQRAGLNRLRESYLGCLRLPQPWQSSDASLIIRNGATEMVPPSSSSPNLLRLLHRSAHGEERGDCIVLQVKSRPRPMKLRLEAAWQCR